MALDAAGLFDAIQSHAMASGLFERVNTHEPKSAPATGGLFCAIWMDEVGPARGSSLVSTSARVVFQVRLFSNMLQDPQDAIDPNLLAALHALMTAYASDFELGGLARAIDLQGMSGAPLSAQAGYVEQDGRMFRVYTIRLPVIVNDAWPQSP
jgi:hypothetical protein